MRKSIGAGIFEFIATRQSAGTIVPGVSLLRGLPWIVRDPLGFLGSLPAYGPVVQVSVGAWRAYVVCDSDVALRALLDERTFDKGGLLFDRVRDFLGNGLVTCLQRDHRRQRRLVQSAFHRDRHPEYARVMSGCIEAVTSSWRDGQLIDPNGEMFALAASIGIATLFGSGLTDSAIADLRRSSTILLAGTFRRILTPFEFLEKLPTPANRRYARAESHVAATVRRIIRDYRHDARDCGDLLSTLLAGREDGAGVLTDSEVYDQVFTFLVGGIETVATTLAWVCQLVARHPSIQDGLHAEARAVLDGRSACWDDLPELELTGRVITETLRMYPPVWAFTRTVVHDTELAGYPISRGSTIIFSPFLLHHRADLFPNPERFDPDRWLHTNTTQRPHGGFIPFGAGARQCIGKDFALTEATMILATIADRWRQIPSHAGPVRPVVRLAITPSATPIRLRRRPNTGHPSSSDGSR